MSESKSFCACFDHNEGQGHEVSKIAASSLSYEKNLGIQETEEFLAAQLSKLSVKERNEAIHDVHCVGEELTETPEILQKSLAEFDIAIQHEKNTTYDIAIAQNRNYVEDPAFRLKFLRANMHDANKAVRQMMSFLEKKAEYFGIEKVARDITLEELTIEDRRSMLSGIYHIPEDRDRTGRVVVYMFNACLGQCTVDSLNRIMYYVFFNILIPMPEVQLKGLNCIYYDVAKVDGDVAMPGFNYVQSAIEFLLCIPVRFSAMHNCLKTRKGNLALNDFILRISIRATPMYSQVRSRIHFGSDMEVQYQLQSHGIPIEHCPIDQDGNVRMDILNDWFYKHLSRSTSCQGNDVAIQQIVPQPHDILLGRRKTLHHLGNICFRQFVKQYSEEYDETPRNHRRLVLVRVVQDLKNRGIRFLRQVEDSEEWIESSEVDMEKTVGQVFRNLRKKNKSGGS
ncbi:MAG: hypothetical protein SGBAC_011090 [Bacillariaceae sp.]